MHNITVYPGSGLQPIYHGWLIKLLGKAMRTWQILAVLMCVPRSSPAAGIPENPQIIASVVEIIERRPPSDPGIFLLFCVHSPSEFRGTQFSLFDSVRQRRAVRTEFPLGALARIELPSGMISGLRRYKVILEENQRKLDAGITPDKITTSPVVPHFDLSKLPRRPSLKSLL